VVVKVPVAAVMCDRNAGAEGVAVDSARARTRWALPGPVLGDGGGWPACEVCTLVGPAAKSTLVRGVARINS
jgi:hypothetical protein